MVETAAFKQNLIQFHNYSTSIVDWGIQSIEFRSLSANHTLRLSFSASVHICSQLTPTFDEGCGIECGKDVKLSLAQPLTNFSGSEENSIQFYKTEISILG